jgi:mRNA-degrading endonuclease RelE of RelBE toxin-antitoxin system
MTYEIIFSDKALRQLKNLEKIIQGKIIAVREAPRRRFGFEL